MGKAIEFQADMVPVENVVGVVFGWLIDLGEGDGSEGSHGDMFESVCMEQGEGCVLIVERNSGDFISKYFHILFAICPAGVKHPSFSTITLLIVGRLIHAWLSVKDATYTRRKADSSHTLL
jgi:hypothetical protein